MFYRDERVLRNRIEDLAILKKTGLVDRRHRRSHRRRQGTVAALSRQALLRAEPARLAPRIGDHRLFFHRRDAGLPERPDYPRGPAGLAGARRDPHGAPRLLSRPRIHRPRVPAQFHALQQGRSPSATAPAYVKTGRVNGRLLDRDATAGHASGKISRLARTGRSCIETLALTRHERLELHLALGLAGAAVVVALAGAAGAAQLAAAGARRRSRVGRRSRGSRREPSADGSLALRFPRGA